jgi:protein-L-isoaspartate O-methyltransferase
MIFGAKVVAAAESDCSGEYFGLASMTSHPRTMALVSSVTKREYALGSDDTEIARLQTQAAFIAEPTTLLLQRGGIRPGMRVLDLGSGPGDVAFHVAEMIGPNGSVVGVDQDPAQIAVAVQRRNGFSFHNVNFRHGDARAFLDEEPFDAVVCRLLLIRPATVAASRSPESLLCCAIHQTDAAVGLLARPE